MLESTNQPESKIAPQRVTPRALLEVKRPSHPQIHPDGRRVAFVVTEADFEESETVSHLWLTEWPAPEDFDAEDTDEEDAGTNAEESADDAKDAEAGAENVEAGEEENDPTRQLTFSLEGEHSPKWSPHGRYLAFVSSRSDPETAADDEDDEATAQVWALPIDGGEARKITAAKEGIIEFHWLPDGESLVYLAPEPRPKPIETVRKDERERRKIDPTVENEEKLRRQFWRIEVEEKKPKLLFTADEGAGDFAVSPDGTRICYATNYSGEDNDYHLTDLYVRALEGGPSVKLVGRGGGKYHLRWSPDGLQIAFLTWLDPALSFSTETVYAAAVPAEFPTEIAPYGQEAPALTECFPLTDLDTDLHGFEWSREEGGGAYLLAATRTYSEIHRVKKSEATPLELEAGATRRDLAIHPEADLLAWAQEGAGAMPEIFLRDETGEVHQLTKLNADFAENYRLPRQEVVAWQSADGAAIEGVLTYPLDYEAGQKYPLIAQIHGGPKGRAVNTLRNYYQSPVWSAEGYFTLQPNFRGSEGYGNAFAVANRRDLGGGDFQDIMAGVDWCVEAGFADPEKLGIMGGSYGGYMTNWAIGHTDRFRAAVSMFGIFHLQTDYSNSELSRWDNDYTGAYYWEDPEIYRRMSPGTYVENIKTPTLILHGEDDPNTFISNSKELYQALRHRGVTTQFVRYPREGHGLDEPNHKLDEVRRCLAWMDRYLKQGGENPGQYRLRDKIPDAAGRLELCVTLAEVSAFPGWAETDGDKDRVLFEVAFTVQQKDAREPAINVDLPLDSLRLEYNNGQESLRPLGVPLDAPGGKVLLQGDNLRLARRTDPEDGHFAFGCAAVFHVPKAGGEGRLTIADFPPVAVAWSGEEE